MATKKEVKETKQTNKNYRRIAIKNYRNIGFNDSTYLTLNRTLDKNMLGNVIILVGPNNVGKSNVLKAIESFGTRTGTNRDFPESCFDENVEPSIILELKNDKGLKIEIPFIIKSDKNASNNNIINETSKIYRPLFVEFANNVENLFNEFITFARENRYTHADSLSNILQKGINEELLTHITILAENDHIINNFDANKLELINELAAHIHYDFRLTAVDEGSSEAYMVSYYDLSDDRIIDSFREEYIKKIKQTLDTKPSYFSSNCELSTEQINFESEYGYSTIPTIYNYMEHHKEFKSEDMNFEYGSTNEFVKIVLKSIGEDPDILDKINDKTDKTDTYLFSKPLKEINNKLKIISKRFNDLYFCDRLEYSFEIIPGKKIFFNMNHGSKDCNLDSQSTGFKWFFNFYFNMLNNNLKPGDIILMDEPATNIHVSGQIELMNFIRDFAKAHGYTFIISTHMPFLIDCDHLDEVRIVVGDNDGNSRIENDFTVISDGEKEGDTDKGADTLDVILKNLTIGRHIMYDPRNMTVFVEGITDYNYLVAFKSLFDVKNIHFIPINGVKNKDLDKKLLAIVRKPILLVDADPAGEICKKKYKDTDLDIISLREIEGLTIAPGKENFEIEDLFTEDEIESIPLKKEYDSSSTFKNNIKIQYADTLSESTKDNFKKVLNHLLINDGLPKIE